MTWEKIILIGLLCGLIGSGICALLERPFAKSWSDLIGYTLVAAIVITAAIIATLMLIRL